MKANRLLVLALSTVMLIACGQGTNSSADDTSNTTTTSVADISEDTSENKTSSEDKTSSETKTSSEQTVYVTSIEVTGVPETMDVNDSVKLSISVLPENATNKKYKITTSNKKVVDASGDTITAYGVGTATITITASDGSGVSKSFDITVLDTIKAPSDWEGAKTLIEQAAGDVSHLNGYSYRSKRDSYSGGVVSTTTTIEKKYEYGSKGEVGYKGTYKFESTDTTTSLLAGYKGIQGDQYVKYEHTRSSYDYVDKSQAVADIGQENAIKDAQDIVEMADFIETTTTSYNWDGDTEYTSSTEDGVITMKYTHQYDATSYAKKGDFTVKVTKYGKLLSAALNNYGYVDGEFTIPNYVESYELIVEQGEKPESISISPTDFFMTENHTAVAKTSGNKGDNIAVVGNYVYVNGEDKTKPYALDWGDDSFTIVSSSNESVIALKSGYKDSWYTCGAGETTLTVKHNNTNKVHSINVTAVLPDATHFDTVKSSEGIQFPIGTVTEFTAALKPNEASQEFVVSSSDSTVLSVEKKDGKWYGTGLKEGTVTVTFSDPAGLAKKSTLDLTVTAKEAEKAPYEGTWISGSNTLVLNSNGNGSWNGTNFTFTYDEKTNKGTIPPFGLFDGDTNYFTYNESKDTVYVDITDSDHEYAYWSGTMTRKAETVVEEKSCVGTWKADSNTMVLEKNGNGTWNGYDFTYTYEESTGKGTMSNFAAFFGDCNTFTYDKGKDTITVYLADDADYPDNVYNKTMTRG